MQPPNWNDLRYLLAIRRGQTLHAAARQLRVDDTTVSRRLASLQRGLGGQLVQRLGDNRLVLTELGERVARDAEAMERHYASIAALVDGNGDACSGTVRLTSVPILACSLIDSAIWQQGARASSSNSSLTVESSISLVARLMLRFVSPGPPPAG